MNNKKMKTLIAVSCFFIPGLLLLGFDYLAGYFRPLQPQKIEYLHIDKSCPYNQLRGWNEGMITKEEALEIAKEANTVRYTKRRPIIVLLWEENKRYIVLFPRDLPPGTRGGGAVSEVVVDLYTGEVLSKGPPRF